jgi:hypothetical protein
MPFINKKELLVNLATGINLKNIVLSESRDIYSFPLSKVLEQMKFHLYGVLESIIEKNQNSCCL